ncbi:hypothetical protein EDC01DRAFT_790902 [Geopyxis carbonaria]|nr:hypothetical protein EDC01DRAFT_790902 [Geopyxis carbonaria]
MPPMPTKAPCSTCNREFANIHALAQHIRDSTQDHHHCFACDRAFHSKAALDQHLHSAAHVAKTQKPAGGQKPAGQASASRPSTSQSSASRPSTSQSSRSQQPARRDPAPKQQPQARAPARETHRCQFCPNATFASKTIATEHASATHAHCYTCSGRFVDKKALHVHRAGGKCPHDNRVSCDVCKTVCADAAALATHTAAAQHPHCFTCAEMFVDKKALYAHRPGGKCPRDAKAAALAPAPTHGFLRCGTCATSFVDAAGLAAHVAAAHPPPPPTRTSSFSVACEFCNTAFASTQLLDRHTKAAHAYCDACSLRFVDKRALGRHKCENRGTGKERAQAGTGAARSRCDFCSNPSASFVSAKELENHLRASHARCFTCNRHFTDKRALGKHRGSGACAASVAASAAVAVTAAPPPPAAAPTTPCPTCSLPFPDKVSLGQHLLVGQCVRSTPVAAARPGVQCAFCNASFSSVKALGSHIETAHSHCADCDMDFPDNAALGRHWAEGGCDRKRRVKEVVGEVMETLREMKLS